MAVEINKIYKSIKSIICRLKELENNSGGNGDADGNGLYTLSNNGQIISVNNILHNQDINFISQLGTEIINFINQNKIVIENNITNPTLSFINGNDEILIIQDEKNLVIVNATDPADLAVAFNTIGTKDVYFYGYPNTRDDTALVPIDNILYTDAQGKVVSAPFVEVVAEIIAALPLTDLNLGNSDLTQTDTNRIYNMVDKTLQFRRFQRVEFLGSNTGSPNYTRVNFDDDIEFEIYDSTNTLQKYFRMDNDGTFSIKSHDVILVEAPTTDNNQSFLLARNSVTGELMQINKNTLFGSLPIFNNVFTAQTTLGANVLFKYGNAGDPAFQIMITG